MTTFALGRHVEHDPRSRLHPHSATPSSGVIPPGDIQWARHSPILDQGDIGCCTGAAMTGWLGCEPHTTPEVAARCTLDLAHVLYQRATMLDNIPGIWPPDDTGSSGLAVAKAAKKLGWIDAYRWAFSAGSLTAALTAGPVVVGMPWYEGMSTPDRDGRLWPHGEIVGGHEVLIRGLIGRDLILSNSWGEGWGLKGEALLPLDVWAMLRKQQADVVVPTAGGRVVS
jgi:hypothetical protein